MFRCHRDVDIRVAVLVRWSSVCDGCMRSNGSATTRKRATSKLVASDPWSLERVVNWERETNADIFDRVELRYSEQISPTVMDSEPDSL